MLKQSLNSVLALVMFSSLAMAQTNAPIPGDHGPGGDPDANAKFAMQNMIEDEAYNLKASIRNYITSVDVTQVPDPIVRDTLLRIGKDALIDDINKSRYVIASGSSESYLPSIAGQYGVKLLPAARTAFRQGADIRFDLDLLFDEIKNMPQEEKIINIASLALHEHVHHFQTKPLKDENYKNAMLSRETEAYRFSGYVLMSAKFGQIPLLKWAQLPTAYKSGARADFCAIYAAWNDKDYNNRFSSKDRLSWEQTAFNKALIKKNYKLVSTEAEASSKIELGELSCIHESETVSYCMTAIGSEILTDLTTGHFQQYFEQSGPIEPNPIQFYGQLFRSKSAEGTAVAKLIERVPTCTPPNPSPR